MAKQSAQDPSPERRAFLEGIGILASAAALGEVGTRSDAAVSASARPSEPAQPEGHEAQADGAQKSSPPAGLDLRGIDPAQVPAEYEKRKLGRFSDAELCRAVADIVSRPGRGLTSFTLHAPLELPARYGLLPFVDPSERKLARVQMVASAAAYDAGVRTLGPAARCAPFADAEAARTSLAKAFRAGHAGELEALMLTAAEQFGCERAVRWLTPLALPTLTSATHAHIGLWLVARHSPTADGSSAALLRAAARALGAEPTEQLPSLSGASLAGTKPVGEPPAELEARVSNGLLAVPKARADSAGMRDLLCAGEKKGHAKSCFGDLLQGTLTAEQIEAAFRGLMRASAYSMLQDDIGEAKYGWSHCLTLPQAAFGLASLGIEPKLGLAAALVWVSAFRAVLGTRTLDPAKVPAKVLGPSLLEALNTSPAAAAARTWHAAPSELGDVRRVLATQASIRNDLHLVKYVRACFDMGVLDPGATHLYLAAAAHLCAVWIAECPRQGLEENLLDGRSTPD